MIFISPLQGADTSGFAPLIRFHLYPQLSPSASLLILKIIFVKYKRLLCVCSGDFFFFTPVLIMLLLLQIVFMMLNDSEMEVPIKQSMAINISRYISLSILKENLLLLA